MPKGMPNKRYTAEFKKHVIDTMRAEKLSYNETSKRFDVNGHNRIQNWERIYLTYGLEGFQIERRGRASKERAPKLNKQVEADLIAENQRLRAELDYQRKLNLICRVRMKKYKSYKDEVGKIAPDLLKRCFEAAKPNHKWITDVTEFSLFGQKIYLSPILDLCSRDIVSYTISDRPVFTMVTVMLDKAFAKIPDNTNLILHSDQGWHYQHKQYQMMLNSERDSAEYESQRQLFGQCSNREFFRPA